MARQIKRFPYTPILGWSATRYDAFSLCKRMYFFNYYAKYDREVSIRTLTLHKKLVTIPLEIGSIVHEVIEKLLRRLKTTTEAIDRPRFLAVADEAIGRSLEGKQYEELVYAEQTEVGVDDLRPKVVACLDSLLESERFHWLVGEAAATSGEWIIDPPGYGETRLGDLKMYAKVDVLFPLGDELYIFDWKTGKSDAAKHRKQLLGYATWAAYHFEVPPERIRPAIAYLHPQYEEVQESFTLSDLEAFAVQVRAETAEMYEYCQDVKQNIPLDKSEFPQVNDERICSHCGYRGICFPEKYPSRL